MEDNYVEYHELPRNRFYYSYNFLLFELPDNSKGQKLHNVLSTDIYSYYEESLALLNSSGKLFEIINKEIQNFEERYKGIGEKLKVREQQCEDDEDRFNFELSQSRYLEEQSMFYRDRDIEINAFSSGIIVQFLSLFESTLHSICQKLIEKDQNLPDINTVCKRDKGTVKYLKYLDKYLNSSMHNVLIGTANYEKLYAWIMIRNNIVHNNNEFKEGLSNISEKHGFSVSKLRNKFLFNEDCIKELSDICGITMDNIVEEKLKSHFTFSNQQD